MLKKKASKKSENLAVLEKTLSPIRSEVLLRLKEHNWFKKSSFELQKTLLTLPADFEACLNDLANRPDEIGNLETLKMVDFKLGNYHAIPVFEVQSRVNNQKYNWDYAVSRFGKNPGFRGLIFVEVDNKIKYFLIKREVRFPLGYETYESIGGYIQFRENKLINLPKNVDDQIRRQLGIKDIVVSRFIDLGQMYPDTAMTNSHISLFAAVIKGDNLNKINSLSERQYKTKKITFELLVVPIERLREFIHKVDESYFHACVTRLLSMGILDLSD